MWISFRSWSILIGRLVAGSDSILISFQVCLFFPFEPLPPPLALANILLIRRIKTSERMLGPRVPLLRHVQFCSGKLRPAKQYSNGTKRVDSLSSLKVGQPRIPGGPPDALDRRQRLGAVRVNEVSPSAMLAICRRCKFAPAQGIFNH